MDLLPSAQAECYQQSHQALSDLEHNILNMSGLQIYGGGSGIRTHKSVRELAEYGEHSDLGAFLGSAETSQISRETFLPFAIVQRTVMGITNGLNS
jgi:hypothetical protein